MRYLIVALILFASCGAWATAQIPEVIELDGKSEKLFSEPFTIYLAAHQDKIPKLERVAQDRCTGSWRGYQGHWVILDEKLYLKSLFANPCRESPDSIPLSTFFPDSTGPVYAEWYTGKLIVPLRKRIRYVHMGYESEYEQYLVFLVKNGHVISRELTSKKPE